MDPNLITGDFFILAENIFTPDLKNYVLNLTKRNISDFRLPHQLKDSGPTESNLNNSPNELNIFQPAMDYHEKIRVAIGKSYFNFFTNAYQILLQTSKTNGILNLEDLFYDKVGSIYLNCLYNPEAKIEVENDADFINVFALYLERQNSNIVTPNFFNKKFIRLNQTIAKHLLNNLFTNHKPFYNNDNSLVSVFQNYPVHACFHYALSILNNTPFSPIEALSPEDIIDSRVLFSIEAINDINQKNIELKNEAIFESPSRSL